MYLYEERIPLSSIEKAAITVRRLDRNDLLTTKGPSSQKTDSVILVTTYEPAQDLLRNITRQNWQYLGKSRTTVDIYQKKIMVGYRRPKNLRDLVVKADCTLPRNYKVPLTNLPKGAPIPHH